MIVYLARLITEFFIRCDVIDEGEQDIYQYGNEIVISTILDFLILFGFALAFHDFTNVFLFWITFFILRKFGGGYHADTYLKCKIVFSINILIVLIMLHYFQYAFNVYLLVLLTLFSCLVIFILAPIDNENKPLSDSELKINAIKCRICSSIVTIFSIVLFYNYTEISFTLVLSHFSVAFAMIFEVIKKKKLI